MHTEDRLMDDDSVIKQEAETKKDCENHTYNILSQSDLNYIIEAVGEISDNDIEQCTEDSSFNISMYRNKIPHVTLNNSKLNKESNNENNSTVPILSQSESFDSTPLPSPYMAFGDINDYSNACESSTIFSDSSVGTSPLASSEISDSSTPHISKKKRMYVKKAITKKRSTNKCNWLDVRRKLLVNLGEAHISRCGKQQKEKQIRSPCKSNCRLKCSQKFDIETRQNIFKTFWNLGDHSLQWSFISSHMKQIRKKQWTQDSKRLNVYKFFMPLFSNNGNKKQIMVCKTMFKNTLSISNTFIQSAIDKYDKNTGFCSKDMRGFHQNHPIIINAAMRDTVIQHVNSFAPVESHYTRKDSNKKFLDSELNFKKMYDLYVIWCKDLSITKNTATSVRQYKDIVNKELNIAFHVPKKDQCDICHAMKNNTSPSNDDKLKHKLHIDNKKNARALKNIDKIEAQSKLSDICTAMFDFQKINNTPHGEISVLYYKRKLSVYNFTIFDAGSKEAACYMWDETVAKRGANEVASCLFSFINRKAKVGVKDFRLWSDNCAGQNRNRIVFFMYLYVSKLFNIDLCHRFLEKGHTQNEADSVHALIERTAKNKLVYVPDEWYALVRWAKQNGPPYEVVEVDQEMIFDFKAWLRTKYWIKDTTLEKILWNKIREVKVSGSNPDIIEFKYDLFEENYRKLDCGYNMKLTRGRKKNQQELLLNKLYREPIPIAEIKYEDLINLCNTMIIPKKYHNFYKNLQYCKGKKNCDEEDE